MSDLSNRDVQDLLDLHLNSDRHRHHVVNELARRLRAETARCAELQAENRRLRELADAAQPDGGGARPRMFERCSYIFRHGSRIEFCAKPEGHGGEHESPFEQPPPAAPAPEPEPSDPMLSKLRDEVWAARHEPSEPQPAVDPIGRVIDCAAEVQVITDSEERAARAELSRLRSQPAAPPAQPDAEERVAQLEARCRNLEARDLRKSKEIKALLAAKESLRGELRKERGEGKEDMVLVHKNDLESLRRISSHHGKQEVASPSTSSGSSQGEGVQVASSGQGQLREGGARSVWPDQLGPVAPPPAGQDDKLRELDAWITSRCVWWCKDGTFFVSIDLLRAEIRRLLASPSPEPEAGRF